jgi:hypothetical protein
VSQDAGPGVPEALPRTLRMIAARLGAATLDRLWIFPPLVRGRKEWGLVAVSRMATGDEDDAPERRRLFTAPYTAERTGKGLTLEHRIVEQGAAPSDRFPRVMDGVVRRSADELGDPREIEVAGDTARFEAFMSEFDPGLFEEEPLAS